MENHVRQLNDQVAMADSRRFLLSADSLSPLEFHMRALHIPMVLLDRNLCVLSVNSAFCRSFSASYNQVTGLSFVDACSPILTRQVLHDFMSRLRIGESVVTDYEVDVEASPLGRRWLLLNAEKISRKSGVVVTIEDVSERKKLEVSLWTARCDAERTNLNKSNFYVVACLELRQRLQNLETVRNVLARKIEDTDGLELIATLNEKANCLFSTLNTLLDIGNFESECIYREEIEFAVDDMLAHLTSEFDLQAHGFSWRMVPCKSTIRSNPHLLNLIMRNLVANSLKYTKRGRILVGCRRRGKKLRIEVWVTGSGFPTDQLQELLTSCDQPDKSEDVQYRGRGFDLALVRYLADLHNYTFDVRSHQGKWLVFAIEVPLARKEVSATEADQKSVSYSSFQQAAFDRLSKLTSRERQVVELVVNGNPNKQVAQVLGISQRTVETHRATAMKKVGARTFTELIRLSIAASP